MTDDVPPGRQCVMADCEREAVDPERNGGLCPEHHPETEAGDRADHADDPTRTEPSEETDEPSENPEPESGLPDEDPTPDASKPGSTDPDSGTDDLQLSSNDWGAVNFAATDADTYPPALLEREQWMGRLAGEKMPFSPWADRDHVEADADTDARYKWGLSENYVDGETVALAEDDPRLDGRVFLQQESDPFAFVDGDDVRDPETGAVHPAFVEVLDALGPTYADVSTSGAGVHAYYEGELPNGQGQATFEIDTEPWGANDDPPTVEIYANKHVCVTTGDHVHGTPTDVRQWDTADVEALLEEYDALKDPEPVDHDTDRDLDLDGHEPDATDRDETTTDARDIAHAVDRLRPSDLPLRARQVDTDATGWEQWDPSSYRTSSGNDSLHRPPGEPVFHDHKHGESFGVLSLFAAEEGILSKPWDRLAGTDWWDAVEAAREAGAPIPEYEGPRGGRNADAEPVAPLGLSVLDALDKCSRERIAQTRETAIPSTDEARDRLRDAVFRELRAGNSTVLDAPTALGKSHTVATEPWRRRTSTTGDAPVVHLHATTDARDEAAAASAEAGVEFATLEGRKEASPLARGDHDPVDDPDAEDAPDITVTIDGKPASEWFDEMCGGGDRAGRGLPFSTALALARERNDQGLDDLPPQGEEDPAVAQWNGIPRTDDGDPAVDVIHATHEFAYVPSLRQHTNVVLDEQPDFAVDLDQDRIRRMVNAYLRAIDAPVSTWEALVSLARFDHNGARSDAGAEQDALDDVLGRDPPTEWYVENPDAHALAPDLTRAIWRALRWEDADANGRQSVTVSHEPPRFDTNGSEQYARTWLSVVIGEDNTVRKVRSTPDFSQARAVVGLDAHPSMPMWQLNADPDMTVDAVLDPQERRLWRRYERGLTVVQVGDATRPRSGDAAREWMNDERVRTVVERLRDHFGRGFRTAIAPAQVEGPVREILQEFDGTVDAENTMHYGAEKSRNDFAHEQAGLLYGCMDPGDDMVLNALAELGLDAEPETTETEAGDVVREKGRGFEGPDAETAKAVLASVRENHVAQAAGRYARTPDDPDSGAVVFAMTDAHPTGFVDVETPGVEWLATDLQREIIDVLGDRPTATTRKIAEAVDCSKDHVRETLQRLEGEDLVERREGAGDHGADVYRDAGADGALADLGLDALETADDRLDDSSRWSLAISRRHGADEAGQLGESTTRGADRATSGGDPPPDTRG